MTKDGSANNLQVHYPQQQNHHLTTPKDNHQYNKSTINKLICS